MAHKVPLKDMNERNARFSKWNIAIFSGQENSRSYMWDGKPRTPVTFDVTIVDVDDRMLRQA